METTENKNKTTESKEGIVFAPWIAKTTATYINGVKVWDCRAFPNILCRLNWLFHFRLRRMVKRLNETKINQAYYGFVSPNAQSLQ